MAAMNTADIGFEKEIWKAADKMRGNIDASEYKSVVLGLSLIHISERVGNRDRRVLTTIYGIRFHNDPGRIVYPYMYAVSYTHLICKLISGQYFLNQNVYL